MKKGDIRKEQIIETAERLFYSKGYEQTSVQDILDELSLSKGGFYHYYDSKLQLLTEICHLQGARDIQSMQDKIKDLSGDPVSQLNMLLEHCGLFRQDNIPFAALMLRVGYLGGSLQLRDCFRQTIIEAALPILNDIIRDGLAQKVFFTRFPDDIGELILQLFANISDEMAMALVRGNEANALTAILNRLEVYRSSIETLISAPFGSIRIYDLTLLPKLMSAVQSSEPWKAKD